MEKYLHMGPNVKTTKLTYGFGFFSHWLQHTFNQSILIFPEMLEMLEGG